MNCRQLNSQILCPGSRVCAVILIILTTNVDSSRAIDVYNAITRYPSSLNWWASAEISFFENVSALNELTSPARRNDNNNCYSLDKNFRLDLDSYIKDYEDSFGGLRGFDGSFDDKVWTIITNPIAAYRMMRRIVHSIPDLLNPLRQYDATLVSMFPTDWWPRLEDIQDAMLGILRINHVYNLNVTLFSEGNILGTMTGTHLDGVHCFEIGMHAFTQNMHTLALEWLELALEKTTRDKTIDKTLIKTALINTVTRHDQWFDSRWTTDPYFFNQKLHPLSNSSQFRKKQRDTLVDSFKGRKEAQYNDVNFWELCSRGSFQSEEVKSKLFCWHETKVHPAWVIGPLKMEMLASNPDVVQIYDVIGAKRIARIKETAQPSMILSNVVDNDKPGATKLSWVRTSVGTWLTESNDPLLASIPHRIEHMTGLKVVQPTSSELLQVASYTFSGHYEIHLDALSQESQYGPNGDRVATFMLYLNDVELGGRTAFAQSGTAAQPVKGSAVFWYDIHSDGTTDYETYHGACPVILGQKWVANKWIRIKDQFLTHQCYRNSSKERYRVSVNGKRP